MVLFDPQRQDKHLVLFSDTEGQDANLIANTVYPVCLCAGRGARRGQGSALVSDGALAHLSVTPLDAGARWAEQARPKHQTLDLLYTIAQTPPFRRESG